LVLDEADRLLEGGFDADLAAVLRALPRRLQTASFSATYPPALRERLRRLLRPGAQEVLLCEDGLRLPAVRHFYLDAGDAVAGAAAGAAAGGRKAAALLRVLRSVAFHQALVFLNQPVSALALAEELSGAGFPAQCVAAAHGPRLRAQAMRAARDFRVRVLVATDLLARGVDLSRTNLVVNLDLPGGPHAGETLVHRLGRTGRFGVRGVAVSVVGGAAELARLQELLRLAEREGGGGGERPERWLSLEPEELPDSVPEEWSEGRPLEAGREQEAWEKLCRAEAEGAAGGEEGGVREEREEERDEREEGGAEEEGRERREGRERGGREDVRRQTTDGRGEEDKEGGARRVEAAGGCAEVGAAPPPARARPEEASSCTLGRGPLDAHQEAYLKWLWWDWRWRWHLALVGGRGAGRAGGGRGPPPAAW